MGMSYEAVIGLEIHAQLLTESKIFCGCSTRFGAPPNSATCPVCLGMPRVLPVANRRVVELAIRTALALHGTIAPRSVFARKNYFYPDLPKGYQISQYELPLCTGGYLDIDDNGETHRIRITRIHMEEDAGKLVYEGTMDTTEASFVDLNRTGVPLLEIVTEPDLRTPAQAAGFLRRLRSILQYLDVCDGNMEQGSFRCDANVSVRPVGEKRLGVKTELKNMNSFRFVERALEYEIQRQVDLLSEGEQIVQETRLWDPAKGQTMGMRGKEEAHDYRYFPDPDLVPIVIDEDWVERIRRSLPELPQEREDRFVAHYGLPRYDAETLTSSKELAEFFEQTVQIFPEPRTVCNWIVTELLKELNADGSSIDRCRVSPGHLAALLALVKDGVLSGTLGKQVLAEMYRTGRHPEEIVQEKGLVQIRDEGELGRAVDQVLAAYPGEVTKYLAGKDKVLGFLVGQVMKATKGKADPKLVNELLLKKLKEGGGRAT